MKLATDLMSCMKHFSNMLKKGKCFIGVIWLRDYTIVCYDVEYKRLTETMSWGQSYDVTD